MHPNADYEEFVISETPNDLYCIAKHGDVHHRSTFKRCLLKGIAEIATPQVSNFDIQCGGMGQPCWSEWTHQLPHCSGASRKTIDFGRVGETVVSSDDQIHIVRGEAYSDCGQLLSSRMRNGLSCKIKSNVLSCPLEDTHLHDLSWTKYKPSIDS